MDEDKNCTDEDVSEHQYELAMIDEFEDDIRISNCQITRMAIRFAKTFGYDIVAGARK